MQIYSHQVEPQKEEPKTTPVSGGISDLVRRFSSSDQSASEKERSPTPQRLVHKQIPETLR